VSPVPPSVAPPVPCLVGPTASGKSEVGVALARAVGGEVIACDAMTVYRGISILTAKPTVPPDVPHHLLDVLDPWETYSAGRFLDDADRCVAEVRGRGRVPLLVGGTVLYLQTFLKGLGPRVGRDEALRAELEARVARDGPSALAARLRALDPVRADAIHPHDVRRLVRAIEIVTVTGRPASSLRGEWTSPDRAPAIVVGLRRGDDDLRRRIEARADAMFRTGLREEVAALLAAPRPPSRELAQALGLADVAAHLRGEFPEAACRERLVRATWRFTRRQATFLRQVPAVWVEVPPDEPPDATAGRVQGVLAERGAAPAPRPQP